MSLEFAAIDFETTGLNPSTNKVIEIGIVRFSSSGKALSEFESLVNANRDVGRTDIHGIKASDLINAPTFSQIANEVISILDGAVLVAHNKSFDFRFLKREFELLGVDLGLFDGLCTMELMSASFPRSPRKLGKCCEFLGIALGREHSALDDARMSAKIAAHVMNQFGFPAIPPPMAMPKVSLQSGLPLRRSEVQTIQTTQGNFLAALIADLPPSKLNSGKLAIPTAQYLDLLDRILEDRLIDKNEAIFLQMTAAELGLSADYVKVINATYFVSLCRAANSDGFVSRIEKNDLAMVGQLLEIDDWNQLVNDAMTAGSSQQTLRTDLAGLSVCFTGQMQISRSDCEKIAYEKGLIVRERVTKDLDLLVVADPLTASTKAKRARAFGTRIIYEQAFFALLGDAGEAKEKNGKSTPPKFHNSKRRTEIEISIDQNSEVEDDDFLDKEVEAEIEAEFNHELAEIQSMIESLEARKLAEEDVSHRLKTLQDVSLDAERESVPVSKLRSISRSVILDLCLHVNFVKREEKYLSEITKSQADHLINYLMHRLVFLNLSERRNSDPSNPSLMGPYWEMRITNDWEDTWAQSFKHLKPSAFIKAELETDFSSPETSTLLQNKSIVITGDFVEFSRSEGQDAILKRGGKSPSSVSGKTFALILGENPGPIKFSKSVEKGIPMLDANGFRFLLAHGYIEGTSPSPTIESKLAKKPDKSTLEVLPCQKCGLNFTRLKTKGRKPHFCGQCES